MRKYAKYWPVPAALAVAGLVFTLVTATQPPAAQLQFAFGLPPGPQSTQPKTTATLDYVRQLPGVVDYAPLSESTGVRRGVRGLMQFHPTGGVRSGSGRLTGDTAAYFDGTGKLTMPTVPGLFYPDTTAPYFTVAFKIRPDTITPTNTYFVPLRHGTDANYWGYRFISGGTGSWEAGSGFTGTAGAARAVNTWSSVVLDVNCSTKVVRSRDRGTTTTSATSNFNSSWPWQNAGHFVIGNNLAGTQGFIGSLQDLVVAKGAAWGSRDLIRYESGQPVDSIIDCVGDSITACAASTAGSVPVNQWPYQLGLLVGCSCYHDGGATGLPNTPGLYTRQPSAAGGGRWFVTNNGVSGSTAAQWVSTYFGPTATSLYGTRYMDGSWSKSVCVIWLGTNDINGGATGATTYANIQSIASAAYTAGYQKVVCIDMIPRGGMTTSAQTERTNLNNLFAADFTTATGSAYVFRPGAGVTWADGYLQASALPQLANTSDTVYHAASGTDPIHPSGQANTTVIAPAVRDLLHYAALAF